MPQQDVVYNALFVNWLLSFDYSSVVQMADADMLSVTVHILQ